MKILQVNCAYKYGSTGKIVYDVHTDLKNSKFESLVCYGIYEENIDLNEKGIYKLCGKIYSKINAVWSRISGLMYGGLFFSTNRLFSIIKKENPDVVHLHCLNGSFVNIYRLVTWLKRKKIKTILTLHAEFMYTANCGYALECEKWKLGCGNCPRVKRVTRTFFCDNTHLSWLKMKKAFEGFNENLIVTAVSPWLSERAKQSPILADKKHIVVYNGLDVDTFKLRKIQDIKIEHGITDEQVVFHVTPFFSNDPNHLKGGYYVIELARKMKNDNVKFVVAGNYDKDIEIPSNMIMLGRIDNQETLAEYYSMADVTIIASKRETFSMVCAESLCCGTPVVGFKAGGPEQISLNEYSSFVEHGDIDALREQVLNIFDANYDKIEISQKAKDVYSKKAMTDKYIKIYLNEWK